MLKIILISALVGIAFQSYMESGMIFGFYGKILKRMGLTSFGKKIAKPLGVCIICNTTWVGMIIAFKMKYDVFDILIIGIAASGLVIILSNCLEFIKEKMN
jgi:hypothetical protein